MYGIFPYIYNLKSTIHVGKYTSPMDGMGHTKSFPQVFWDPPCPRHAVRSATLKGRPRPPKASPPEASISGGRAEGWWRWCVFERLRMVKKHREIMGKNEVFWKTSENFGEETGIFAVFVG